MSQLPLSSRDYVSSTIPSFSDLINKNNVNNTLFKESSEITATSNAGLSLNVAATSISSSNFFPENRTLKSNHLHLVIKSTSIFPNSQTHLQFDCYIKSTALVRPFIDKVYSTSSFSNVDPNFEFDLPLDNSIDWKAIFPKSFLIIEVLISFLSYII